MIHSLTVPTEDSVAQKGARTHPMGSGGGISVWDSISSTHTVLPSQVKTVLAHEAQEDSALGPRKMS